MLRLLWIGEIVEGLRLGSWPWFWIFLEDVRAEFRLEAFYIVEKNSRQGSLLFTLGDSLLRLS